jgi:cysteinyl-tRNA synthetase
VYFKISSFPGYGRLSHLDTRELQHGAAVDVDEYEKEGIADFVLWKARKPEDGANYWTSPWGEGRPGWHLECSAMTREYLGDTFDLHSGGVDLMFPHHENEIAQSECCTGKQMSRLWFHVNHLLVDGRKMAKSLQNMYTLDELIEKGHTPARLRFSILSGHYRTPLNFTLGSLDAAKSALEKISKAEKALAAKAGNVPAQGYEELRTAGPAAAGPFGNAFEALESDLNTPEALGRIFATLNRLKIGELSMDEAGMAHRGLHFLLAALGLDLSQEALEAPQQSAPEEVVALAQARWQAKQEKRWADADTLRGQVDAAGWTIKDTKEGFELTAKA